MGLSGGCHCCPCCSYALCHSKYRKAETADMNRTCRVPPEESPIAGLGAVMGDIRNMTPLAASNPATRNDRRLSDRTNAAADRTSSIVVPIKPAIMAVVPNAAASVPPLHAGLL